MDDLKRQLGRGLRWSAIGQAAVQVGQIPLTILLARLLAPADFGLVGQVAVFTGVAYLLADFGLGAAIVREKEVSDEQLSSIFWLNLAVGGSFSLLYAAASPLIAAFYGDLGLVPITIGVGLAFLLSSGRVVQTSLLRRPMSFKHLAGVDTATAIFSLGGAVVLAWLGAGVWSLVAQRLLRAGVPLVLLWSTVKWRPRWAFSFPSIRGMLRFGGYLLAFNTLNYSGRNIDNLLIGKTWGEHVLGLYLKAFEFMMLPLEQISQVVTRVTVPAMSRLQDDHEASASLWWQGVRWIGFVSFPVMALASATAYPLVVTVFGPQWAEAAPVLARLAIGGITGSIGTTVGWVFLSQGRSDLMLRWELFSLPVRITAIAVGLAWGAVGVANGLLVFQFAQFLPLFVFTASLVGQSPRRALRELAAALLGPLVCTAGAVGVGLTATWLAGVDPKSWTVLVIAWPSGLVVYLLLARGLGLRTYRELSAQVLGRRRSAT